MSGGKRSSIPANFTIVATINAASDEMPPVIILNGQHLQEDWIDKDVDALDATYPVTDSILMQGPVFLTFFEKIHRWLRDSKIDGKRHAILLDSHAHIALDVIPLTSHNSSILLYVSVGIIGSPEMVSLEICYVFVGAFHRILG